jgi:hypothetical protein
MCDNPCSTQKRSTCNRLSKSFRLIFKVTTVKPVDYLIVERITAAKSLLNSKVGAIGDMSNGLVP